jgi:hypothetical protein
MHCKVARCTAVLTFVVLGPLLAACDSTSSTARATSAATLIPHGWKTYTFDRLAISVPKSWSVAFGNSGCPTGAPGLLALEGAPVLAQGCPAISRPNANTVRVSVLAAGGFKDRTCPSDSQRKIVNAAVVCAGPRSMADTIEWAIPSLGAGASGSGPLASKVMHTIRRG